MKKKRVYLSAFQSDLETNNANVFDDFMGVPGKTSDSVLEDYLEITLTNNARSDVVNLVNAYKAGLNPVVWDYNRAKNEAYSDYKPLKTEVIDKVYTDPETRPTYAQLKAAEDKRPPNPGGEPMGAI
jgi:hypothetical protein